MKNYFKIFNIEEKFEVDEDYLEEIYLEFQRNFHPDRLKNNEIEKSIEINEGYEILMNPIRRGAHLLLINGIDIENDSNAPKVDQESLMKIFQIQEEISEADKNKMEEIKAELKQELRKLFLEFSEEIDKKNIEKAAQILIKAKYFSNTIKEIK